MSYLSAFAFNSGSIVAIDSQEAKHSGDIAIPLREKIISDGSFIYFILA